MKKKILLVYVLLGISTLCFAKGNFELFGGIPTNWDNGIIMGYDAKAKATSLSLGFGLISPINDRIGFGVYDEIIFPQKIEASVNGKKTSADRDDYKSLMGMSVLLGPVFYLYSVPDGKIKIPLITGLRWMWLAASTDYTSLFGNCFGLKAGIGIELHPSEKVYIFGRLMGAFDFYSASSVTTSGYDGKNTEKYSGGTSSFGLTPHIGIGFVF